METMKSNVQGFTLIELLIVVAIIGILAAIAVPNFMNAQIRAKVAKVEGDFRSLATALESYRLDRNGYPPYPSIKRHISGYGSAFKLYDAALLHVI